MNRDPEIIRQLMIDIESSSEPKGVDFEDRFESYAVTNDIAFFVDTREKDSELRDRDYNLILMKDAGLVEFSKNIKDGEFRGGFVRLTNSGHDALDAIRDDTTWKNIKDAAPDEAYSIVKSLTSSVGAKALAVILGIG